MNIQIQIAIFTFAFYNYKSVKFSFEFQSSQQETESFHISKPIRLAKFRIQNAKKSESQIGEEQKSHFSALLENSGRLIKQHGNTRVLSHRKMAEVPVYTGF